MELLRTGTGDHLEDLTLMKLAYDRIDGLMNRIEMLTSGPGGIMEMKQTIADKEDEIARLEAALKKQEAITKDDTDWLKAYHKWCGMNGFAPSSSDLITARAALAGEKSDD